MNKYNSTDGSQQLTQFEEGVLDAEQNAWANQVDRYFQESRGIDVKFITPEETLKRNTAIGKAVNNMLVLAGVIRWQLEKTSEFTEAFKREVEEWRLRLERSGEVNLKNHVTSRDVVEIIYKNLQSKQNRGDLDGMLATLRSQGVMHAKGFIVLCESTIWPEASTT